MGSKQPEDAPPEGRGPSGPESESASHPEQRLVQDASRGDLGAVEELLARHLPRLAGFVRKNEGGLPRNKESTADIVQSVCREVLEGLKEERFEYRGEAEFRGWLFEAALFKIKNRRRYWAAERRDPQRERRAQAGPESDLTSPGEILAAAGASPSEDVASIEEAKRVRSLLDRLPERYRRVIELAHVEGLPHREIATRLEITEGSSRMLLSRALARLATLSDGPEGTVEDKGDEPS